METPICQNLASYRQQLGDTAQLFRSFAKAQECDPSSRDTEGWTALDWAISQGRGWEGEFWGRSTPIGETL